MTEASGDDQRGGGRRASVAHHVTRWRSTGPRLAPLLRSCLSGDSPSPPPTELVERVADLVDALPAVGAYHRVSPWLVEALSGHPAVAGPVADDLRRQERDALTLHLRAMATLAHLAGPLDAAGIRWLVFKGPTLAKLVYSRPVLRTYGDLDVLVDRRDFLTAVDALRQAGFDFANRNWHLINGLGAGELSLSAPGHGALDLHWHPLFTRALRELFPIPVEELLDRSRLVSLGGHQIRILDATDVQLHLALHAAIDGGDRLLWLKDLEQAARHDAPDWDALVRRANSWRVRVPTAVMLGRSRAVLNAPVPDEVMRALLPNRPWRSVVGTVDAAFPVTAGVGRGDPATLLARAARQDERSTMIAVGRGLALRGRRLIGTGHWERDGRRYDNGDPASLQYPAGGEADRDAYLSWVGAGE